jgi:hypothetical protein
MFLLLRNDVIDLTVHTTIQPHKTNIYVLAAVRISKQSVRRKPKLKATHTVS